MPSSVAKPCFTVNSHAPVQQLASLGEGLVVVLYEGSAAVLNSRGILVWSSEAQHVALAQLAHSAVVLEPGGGGTLLTAQSPSVGGMLVEDLFLDRVASGDGVSGAIGAPHGCLALECGR